MNNEIIIWQYLKDKKLTEAGIAGLMGNLYAESGLKPTNLQNTYEKKLGFTDDSYTKAVDNGSYDNFIHDSAGYGLAQWTFWSRKQNLLNFVKKRNISIGDLNTQLDFLIYELSTGYKNLLNLLKTTNSIEEASNAVLLQFERPADTSIEMQNRRFQYSQNIFNNNVTKPQQTTSQMKYNNVNLPLQCFQKNSTCYKQTKIMKPVGVLWHSTGSNNPMLKRYIQPLESDKNYDKMIKIIGLNNYKNDYNHASYQSGVNCWIGKLADGTVASVQSMPWNYLPWGCGKGEKGSCNNGWIQFEICEDNLTDENYFNQVYEEACQITAYLCKKYNINPFGFVKISEVNIPTILCHADSHKLGFGSNHADVNHWFTKFGKTMEDVRNDVYQLMNNLKNPKVQLATFNICNKEEEEMTQEQFNIMMNNWIAEQAKKPPSDWSAPAREWCERNGLISGDEKGNKMYKKMLTREEFFMVLYRALHRNILD